MWRQRINFHVPSTSQFTLLRSQQTPSNWCPVTRRIQELHFPRYPSNHTTQSIPGQQVMSVASWPPGGTRLHKGPTWIGPSTLTSSTGRLTLAIHIYIYIYASCSVVSKCATPWTVAHQASLSIGFPRQEYWSGLPFPSPGDLPDPGIEPRSPTLQVDSLPAELPGESVTLSDTTYFK